MGAIGRIRRWINLGHEKMRRQLNALNYKQFLSERSAESPTAITMNILLDAEQTAFIQTQLNSGQFATAEEVIRTALQTMAAQQVEYQTWLEETSAKIKVGMAAHDRGDVIDGETFIAELQQKIEQRKAQSA
jgi:antitoxin ParD1/3/4